MDVYAGPVNYPSARATELRQGPASVSSHRRGERGRAGGSPAEHAAGNRLLVLLLFWFMLAASVAIWLFETPAGSVGDAAGVMTAVGRITGMAGGFILLAQVLMTSRVSWLEDWLGAHALLIWHRRIGAVLLALILTHVAAITVGYAWTDDLSVVAETRTLLTTYEDMVSAFVATGILVGIGLLGIRALRRRMPYELWHFLHMSTYLILLLGYGHQLANGEQLNHPGFGVWYWTVLYLFVIACLVWGRLVEPIWFNLRHRLRVAEVVDESDNAFSVYLTGSRLDVFGAQAGQYLRWRFLAGGCWWQSHPFSLSAAPNPRWLRLTITVVGRYTDRLCELKPGTRVVAEGPSGQFTAGRRTGSGPALLVAGGSGIAPIRALMEEMPAGSVLIYRASTPDDMMLRDELESISWDRRIYLEYVVGGRDDPDPRYVFSPEGLGDIVPDIANRDVYLCGPPGLIGLTLDALRDLDVPDRQIHLDPFEF